MQLKDRITIVNEENFKRLTTLYGDMSIDDLERIVNKHMSVVIEEIEEDMNKHSLLQCCNCKYLQCVNIHHEHCYCDNEKRTDDMGRVDTYVLQKTSPNWCPRKKEEIKNGN